jgi:hypothetical protein
MTVGIGNLAAQILFWEYSFQIFGIVSLQCMIYVALYVMFFMRADPLLGQVGGGQDPGNLDFLGPKWHSPNGLMPFNSA